MKLHQLKTRLIISVTFGLIALLIYNFFLAEVKHTNVISFSNIMNALWKSIPFIEAFLVPSVLSLIVISLPVLLFKKRKSRQVIISITIGFALILGTFKLESKLNQKRLAYKTLNTVQVIALYEKMINKEDIKAISEIAVHPNLPDSIREKLSDSEFMEIRRNIAYETDSEEILKKLSSDKEWEVRLAVATNKLTPLEIMDKLQNDTNENVRILANSMIQQRN